MSEALAVVREREPVALPAKLLRLLPGIALLTVIGYAGKLTEAGLRDYGKAHHLAMPNLEYVLWAIVFGLAISNTIGVANIFKPGIATYDFWLKVGIVLLGAPSTRKTTTPPSPSPPSSRWECSGSPPIPPSGTSCT